LGTGLDPAVSTRFFRAQLEANKVVQRGLHGLWMSCPRSRPRERPDLATEVRPELDEITDQMLDQLKASIADRYDKPTCGGTTSDASCVAVFERLDELHREALLVALAPALGCRLL
jgi:chorismate mutase